MTLAKKKIKEYCESGGTRCPYCGSSDICGSSVEIDNGLALQGISCDECGKVWTDIYRLVSIKE